MIPPGGHRSERQVVIGEVLVVRLWCCVLVRLVVVSLRGIVAPQLAAGAVFDRGGDEVEAFHEVGDGQRRGDRQAVGDATGSASIAQVTGNQGTSWQSFRCAVRGANRRGRVAGVRGSRCARCRELPPRGRNERRG